MIIVVQIDAPISDAETIKELLAYKIEGVGNVKILDIKDDGYNQQFYFLKQERR